MQFKEVLAVHGPLVCAYPIVCYYLINFDVVAYEVFFVQGISCHEISLARFSPPPLAFVLSPAIFFSSMDACFVLWRLMAGFHYYLSHGVAIQSKDRLVPKVEVHLSVQLLTLRNITE